MSQQTLPQLLFEKADTEGEKVAFRQKNLGIWNEWTWKDYYKGVQSLALGLREHFGLQKSEKVGIIGDNRPQWIVAELAVQSVGAVPVGIYQDAPLTQLIQYLQASQPRLLIVEDQEQVDKLLEIIDLFPDIESIIYYNDKGLRTYTHSKLQDFKKIQAHGGNRSSEDPTLFENVLAAHQSTDIALITFTSGVTGDPKAATFTHANIIHTARSINEVDTVEEDDDYLSFLSLASVCEQVIAVGLSLTRGMTINFPEEPSTILNDLREIGPHLIQAPPRTYENILAHFHIRMNDSTRLKKKMYALVEPYIWQKSRAKLSNRSVSFSLKLSYLFGDFFIYSAIRDHLGLSRVKRAYVTGGALNDDAYEFFQGLGVNIKHTYGTVETTGYVSIQSDDEVKTIGSGRPLPGAAIDVTQGGEFQVKGPQVFAGYLHQDRSNSFLTGDYGQLMDTGEIHIVGRTEERGSLNVEGAISSSQIETALKKSPYLQEAVVFGEGRPYRTAMVTIHRASVGRWAEKNQITYTSYQNLSMKPEVIQFIREEVMKMVHTLPEDGKIKRFVILPEELQLAEGEMTSTQKVVRRQVGENYKQYLAALYNDEGQFDTIAQTFEGEHPVTTDEITIPIISLDVSQGVA